MCVVRFLFFFFFFFQAEDGIRDAQESRGLGDVYKRQVSTQSTGAILRQPLVAAGSRACWTEPSHDENLQRGEQVQGRKERGAAGATLAFSGEGQVPTTLSPWFRCAKARIRREKELMKILGEKKQQRDISQEIALNNTESQKQCGAGCFNFIKNLNPWAARDEAAAMQQPLNTPSGDDYHYKGLL
eukprot:TRINITY_DN10218_c0_g1_i9.p1 TRINITY_DN10218_c0_g1~~TRINITY_DN10218_c0_g1_i9.p1  ORF type:complete len:186 (-),score=61.70 TRINITY_DN10218_c0_g1_i9:215-772(-)